MSSTSIDIISPEEIKRQYWDQLKRLTDARNETIRILRAFGEDVDEDVHKDTVAIRDESERQSLGTTALMRIAFKNMKKRFTREDVINYITSHYPDHEIKPRSISALMSALSKEGEITVVSEGGSGILAIYSLPQNA